MKARTPELTPQVFAIVNALLEERVGLSYSLSDRALLGDKLGARMVEAGFESALDYYYFLRYDEEASREEFDLLVESLVVHETFFFRELDQLQVVVNHFLRPLVEAGRRPRVWSAACASGEEPLTIAMLLSAAGIRDEVDILATDISNRVLSRARESQRGRRAVRSSSLPTFAKQWLEQDEAGWRVHPSLAAGIDWRQLNLLDRSAIAALPEQDVILCRNVLFYFRDDVSTAVVDSLRDRLRPGGGLFVSVSESLMRLGTSLVCEEHNGVFVYRRPT